MSFNGRSFNGREDIMRTVNIGIEKIDRIYHVADVHVRNVKRHKEYEQVFKKLYAYIKKTKTPNSVIYLAGDIVHAKTDMSPELVFQVSTFFKRLADIAPTLLITGNHDCNLNNSNRLDALTPIVTALNHPNLHYLKDNGVYLISGIHFNVMSVFDKPADFIKASDFEGDYKIALHHGAVNNATTDAGFVLSNDHVTTNIFDGHDLALLGDIHKPQYLNDEKTVAYAGSLIQQNHGEGLEHGILVWDIETRQAKFIEIENQFGYYTFNVVNGKITNPSDKVPKKPRLRLKVEDTDSADLKSIVAEIRKQYSVQEIAIQKVNAINSGHTNQKINFGDVRDPEWQNKVISEFLYNELALDDETLDVVRHINRTVHSKLPDSELTRNVIWSPKTFEFSNMFSYGENNSIDFGNVQGVNGLFAPNASGKSTLLDALAFCCFDKCSRTSKAVHVLNNKKSSFKCKFGFDLDGKLYYVERTGKQNKNGHVKVDVDFWHEDENGNVEMLNGDQRDSTNKIIRQYLGSYEDFVLTALSLQNNNTGFIDKSQRERKELLTQFLDIDVFEKQYQIAAEDIRETSSIIKEYKRQDYSYELAECERQIAQISKPLDVIKESRDSHVSMVNDLTEIIVNLTAELKHIDSEISDINGLKESREKIVDQIQTIEHSLFHKKEHLNNTRNELINITTKLESYNPVALKDLVTEADELNASINVWSNKAVQTQIAIDHVERIVSKLDDHKWDPDCEYCMANPWLHESKESADKLPVLLEERDEIENMISKLQQRILEIKQTNVYEDLEEYNSLQSKVHRVENAVLVAEGDVNSYSSKLSSKKDSIKLIDGRLKEAYSRKDDIAFNKKKRQEISEIKDEQDSLLIEISEFDEKILTMTGKLQVAESNKANALKAIQRLKELEIQYKGYEYYLKAVKRDGVPYQLISKALPQIEAEINNILAQIVDFSVMLETDGKNINGYIVYDDDNYWPLELTSGMEKFISSLAIRTSLINITSLPRPNFLAIDEGFGVLDSDNLNSMYLLFDYLKSQFGFVMCISHIDAMRDIVDKLIEIKKIKGYSQINYN